MGEDFNVSGDSGQSADVWLDPNAGGSLDQLNNQEQSTGTDSTQLMNQTNTDEELNVGGNLTGSSPEVWLDQNAEGSLDQLNNQAQTLAFTPEQAPNETNANEGTNAGGTPPGSTPDVWLDANAEGSLDQLNNQAQTLAFTPEPTPSDTNANAGTNASGTPPGSTPDVWLDANAEGSLNQLNSQEQSAGSNVNNSFLNASTLVTGNGASNNSDFSSGIKLENSVDTGSVSGSSFALAGKGDATAGAAKQELPSKLDASGNIYEGKVNIDYKNPNLGGVDGNFKVNEGKVDAGITFKGQNSDGFGGNISVGTQGITATDNMQIGKTNVKLSGGIDFPTGRTTASAGVTTPFLDGTLNAKGTISTGQPASGEISWNKGNTNVNLKSNGDFTFGAQFGGGNNSVSPTLSIDPIRTPQFDLGKTQFGRATSFR